MKLIALPQLFAICQLKNTNPLNWEDPYIFVAKTEDELSVVCEINSVPQDALQVDLPWRALKIAGTLDFGLIGIIANLSSILAKNGISVFVISTYNTDYLLLKDSAFEQAVRVLRREGHIVSG